MSQADPILPLAQIEGQRPFTEMRQAVRRREDTRACARGFLTGFLATCMLWAVIWFAAHALVTALVLR